MARSRPLESYPLRQFVALFTRVATQREILLVPCSPAQAATMRGELYAFRRQCEKNVSEATDLGIPVELLRDVSFRIQPTGLEALHQSQMQTPALIEAALGASPNVKTGAEIALERLRAMGVMPDVKQ